MFCLAIGITSCLDDANAKATCTYAVVTDSITYDDTLDATYDSIIQVSLKSLGVSYYTFQESAEVDQSMPAYAIAQCNTQASEKFETSLKKAVTLETVQNEMYKSNSDLFTSLGITHATAIGLHPFTIHLSIWNYTNNSLIQSGDIHVTQ